MQENTLIKKLSVYPGLNKADTKAIYQEKSDYYASQAFFDYLDNMLGRHKIAIVQKKGLDEAEFGYKIQNLPLKVSNFLNKFRFKNISNKIGALGVTEDFIKSSAKGNFVNNLAQYVYAKYGKDIFQKWRQINQINANIGDNKIKKEFKEYMDGLMNKEIEILNNNEFLTESINIKTSKGDSINIPRVQVACMPSIWITEYLGETHISMDIIRDIKDPDSKIKKGINSINNPELKEYLLNLIDSKKTANTNHALLLLREEIKSKNDENSQEVVKLIATQYVDANINVINKRILDIKDVLSTLSNKEYKNQKDLICKIKYLLNPSHFYPLIRSNDNSKTQDDISVFNTYKNSSIVKNDPQWDQSRTTAYPDFYNPAHTNSEFDFSNNGIVTTNGRVARSPVGYLFYIYGLIDQHENKKSPYNLSSYILDHKTREDLLEMSKFFSGDNVKKIEKATGIRIEFSESKDKEALGIPKIKITHNGGKVLNVDFVSMLKEEGDRIKNVFADDVGQLPNAMKWIDEKNEMIFKKDPQNPVDYTMYSCAQGMSRSNLMGMVINTIKYVEGIRHGLITENSDKFSSYKKIIESGDEDKICEEVIMSILKKAIHERGMDLSFIHSVTGKDHNAVMPALVAGPNGNSSYEVKEKYYGTPYVLNEADQKVFDKYSGLDEQFIKNLKEIYNKVNKISKNDLKQDFNISGFSDLIDPKQYTDIGQIASNETQRKLARNEGNVYDHTETPTRF